MRFKKAIGFVLMLLVIASPFDTAAATSVYALVIGNNAAPEETGLPTLRYADDDAIRFYRFFNRFADNVSILTVADDRTQRRYPDIISDTEIPSLENFNARIDAMKQSISNDNARGHTTSFYLVFSGHGTYGESGEPYLVLPDGRLTHDRLFEALASLNSDFIHLFIDACYADGVVGFRGMFSDETDGSSVRLPEATIHTLFRSNRLFELPGLGVVMATSESQKTHEWSRLESGVFTHEVLSGLSGPADVNLDGKVEYSELLAFVSSANREIVDERGKVDIIARPPERNQRVPLVDIRKMSKTAYLTGDPSGLGHFFIELGNGERYLGANLSQMRRVHIALPAEHKAYIQSDEKEASLKMNSNDIVDVGSLDFSVVTLRSKGSIETALKLGLFRTAYGRSYYKGFIDSTEFVGVGFDEPLLLLTPSVTDVSHSQRRLRRNLAISSFAVAGAAVVMAGFSGALALRAKSEFEETTIETPSLKIRDEYRTLTALFWPMVAIVPVALIVGWALLPRNVSKPPGKNAEERAWGITGGTFTVRF